LQPHSLGLINRHSINSITDINVAHEDPCVERSALTAIYSQSVKLFENSVFALILEENARLVVTRMSERLRAVRNSLRGSVSSSSSSRSSSSDWSETVDDQQTRLGSEADLEAEEQQHAEQERRRERNFVIY